jgi:hypothetical protein
MNLKALDCRILNKLIFKKKVTSIPTNEKDVMKMGG